MQQVERQFRVEYEDGTVEHLFGQDINEVWRWLIIKLRRINNAKVPVKIEEVK